MHPLNVCIATQTPLVQFGPVYPQPNGSGIPSISRDEVADGGPHRLSPGGVTRMVYPLAARMIETGRWGEVHWVALNPKAPKSVRFEGITLHHVGIDAERMRAYGTAKEAIWSTVHGLKKPRGSQDLFWSDDYGDYVYYNRTTSELVRRLDQEVDFDLFYVHDFQLLPLGKMVDTLKPKVFRWHIPFDEQSIPPRWRSLITTHLGAYDLVVVSADRYLAALRRFGYTGRVERVYPFVDPSEYSQPTPAEAQSGAARFGVDPDDVVALVVARMDPTKGQDRAIDALARLAPRHPRLRLVLVGNGSFSGSAGGPSVSKSTLWRRHLEKKAHSLGVADRVVFTGHVTQTELDCLYERCQFTVLPSVREGFGLVVVESWLHEKPALVTSAAGVADLIEDGVNGFVCDPDSPESMADRINRLLEDPPGRLQRLARNGRKTAEKCTLRGAVDAESRLFGPMLEAA